MNKPAIKYIVFIALIISLFACDKEVESFQYPFSSLSKLRVDNDISIRLIQDSANYIEIVGPAFVVKNIIPEINGDTVMLSNPGTIGIYSEEIVADIHFTDFRTLFLRNGGDVVNKDTLRFSTFTISSNKAMGHVKLDLICENLSIGISTGSLSLDISGSANYARVWTSAPGFIDMQKFEAKVVDCLNNSSNDCYVWATQKLTGNVQYLGKIFYRGNPEVLIIPMGQEEQILPLD
ncbi:MAG: DUF2807 domain-containing protein [Bacteroidales bacterium]|jgi:hypothetical protein|nr:DUF2807 domain-containing protein [Bacteroidales bacterium]